MLLKFLKKFSLLSTIFGSFILIIFLAISKFNILPLLKNHMGYFGGIVANYVEINSLEYTINSSIIVAISNFTLYILSCIPEFNFAVRNSNLKSDSSELPLANSSNEHIPKYFYFYAKVNYRNSLSYKLCNLCGGVLLEVTYPEWIDTNIDARFWNTSQFIDNNTRGVITIDIHSALPNSKLKNYSGEIYSRISFITNLSLISFDEGYINASLKPKSNNCIKKFFANLFIVLFYDLSYDTHIIKACS